MSINQKSGRQTVCRRFVSGSLFVSPCPPECNFQSETKVEPDLRLLNRNNTLMLAHVLNNSWRDRVTNAELYGDLSTLSDSIGFRTLGLACHCHCHRELPTSQLVPWRTTQGHRRESRDYILPPPFLID